MLGWFIVVYEQIPEERASAPTKEARLARWEAGLGGVDWLEGLVKVGKAERLIDGGYPSRYAALARDVLPLIAGGPPCHVGPMVVGDDYVTPGGWIGQVTIDNVKVAQCSPDQPLTIEVWDQS